MSDFATVAWKSLNGKNYPQIDFPHRAFYITFTDPDIRSPKSLRTLFDKFLDHMLVKCEQNRIVRNIQMVKNFNKVLTPV